MYLNASTDKIEIVLGGTVATNQLQWNVSYQDITSSGMTLPQSGGAGLTNNATAVDIVAAPAASTTRQVTQINVYNADTATATVTIQKDVSGTNYVLISYALTTLDTLMWSREDGWRVMSGGSSSAITALTGDVTATGPGSAAATIANDAVTYAKMQNVSAASRLLGRGSAGGAGDVEEITLGSGLSMTGTSLSATGAAYTFSTGLTNTSGTVTANLSTGVAGGQSVVGGTAASNSLTLSSTTNATKGKILFGTSAYDEVNNRLGIGNNSPTNVLQIGSSYNSNLLTGLSTPLVLSTLQDTSLNYTLAVSSSINSSDRGVFLGVRSRGTLASPTAVTSGDDVFAIIGAGYDGTAPRTRAGIFFRVDGTVSLDNVPTSISFENGSTSRTEKLRIVNNGNVIIQNGGTFTDGGFRLDVNGTARVQGRVTVNQDTTVTTQTVSVITTDTTNAGLVLAPNGTGALMADVPDGSLIGGNARGNNAVDFQIDRNAATAIASGLSSVIVGGRRNTSSNNYTFVGAGSTNTASGSISAVVGGSNNISAGANSFVGGGSSNEANAANTSIAGGANAIAYLTGQRSNASGSFAASSDAQTSAITMRRSITGTAITELTLDGTAPAAGSRAILSIAAGPTNARAWRAQVDVVAIVQTAGTGTLVLGECFMGSYHVGIKRIGANTSLVGTVSVTNEVSDTNMATSVVTIDADNTNEALRIQFTPPTGGTSSATSVIRVVATAYLTEVGY